MQDPERGAEIGTTRTELELAMGQDWLQDDPSWEPPSPPEMSLLDRAFPLPPGMGTGQARTLNQGYQAPYRPHIERDFGPDLGMGL